MKYFILIIYLVPYSSCVDNKKDIIEISLKDIGNNENQINLNGIRCEYITLDGYYDILVTEDIITNMDDLSLLIDTFSLREKYVCFSLKGFESRFFAYAEYNSKRGIYLNRYATSKDSIIDFFIESAEFRLNELQKIKVEQYKDLHLISEPLAYSQLIYLYFSQKDSLDIIDHSLNSLKEKIIDVQIKYYPIMRAVYIAYLKSIYYSPIYFIELDDFQISFYSDDFKDIDYLTYFFYKHLPYFDALKISSIYFYDSYGDILESFETDIYENNDNKIEPSLVINNKHLKDDYIILFSEDLITI